MVVAAGVDVVAVVLLLWYMQSRRVYFYLTVLTLHLKTLFFSNFFDFHFPPAAQKQTPYLQGPHPVGHPRHVIVPNLQWQSILATFLPRCPNTRRPMGHPPAAAWTNLWVLSLARIFASLSHNSTFVFTFILSAFCLAFNEDLGIIIPPRLNRSYSQHFFSL